MLDHKFCVYKTLLKVPLIVRCPSACTAGKKIADPVQTTDIFATIAESTGGAASLFSDRTPSLLGA